MEMAFVTKTPYIHLQGLEFDTALIGHIVDAQGSEIGLAGLGTQATEFRDANLDAVITIWLRIVEGFEVFGGGAGHNRYFKVAVALSMTGGYLRHATLPKVDG